MEDDTAIGAGRPTKFKPEYCDQAYKLCLLGAIDADLADFFEVAASTVYLWKNEYPEFADQIRNGKKIADMHLASKLYNRAEGAEWVEEQAFKIKKRILRRIRQEGPHRRAHRHRSRQKGSAARHDSAHLLAQEPRSAKLAR
jgi:hypothetical protein